MSSHLSSTSGEFSKLSQVPARMTVKRNRSYLSILTLVVSIFILGWFVYDEAVLSISDVKFHISNIYIPIFADPAAGKNGQPFAENIGECDVFDGNWVLDDLRYPLYREENCEFMSTQFSCLKNGRKDDIYQKWRWRPRDCMLPRFNSRRLLGRLTGKRLMFVGDSLHRNQWESLVCLLQSGATNKSVTKEGSITTFHIFDYNATVEFYWAPFLVESNSDNPSMHSILDRIIKPDSIYKHGVHWKGVDYLVFNSYIWWMNTSKMKILKGESFDEESMEYDDILRPTAYERVIRTWANWVDQNIDPNATSVFFSSMSPIHYRSEDWNGPNGTNCAMETRPILDATGLPPSGTDKRLLGVVENVTESMRMPVMILNITALSEYRKDAHASVYTIRQGKLISPEQQADPMKYADCIHWCLPGLPDTWNELLYAKIMSSRLHK